MSDTFEVLSTANWQLDDKIMTRDPFLKFATFDGTNFVGGLINHDQLVEGLPAGRARAAQAAGRREGIGGCRAGAGMVGAGLRAGGRGGQLRRAEGQECGDEERDARDGARGRRR